jgi:hypothetical protein
MTPHDDERVRRAAAEYVHADEFITAATAYAAPPGRGAGLSVGRNS